MLTAAVQVDQAGLAGTGNRNSVDIVAHTAGNRVGPEVGRRHLQGYKFEDIFVDPEVAGTAEGYRTDLKKENNFCFKIGVSFDDCRRTCGDLSVQYGTLDTLLDFYIYIDDLRVPNIKLRRKYLDAGT